MLSLVLPAAALAQRTDVVVLINGDSVTGEVESLEFGTLEYSTDSMGTVSIDWEDVISVTSNQTLEVETSGGTRYFGNLMQPPGVNTVSVGRGENITDLAMGNVVRMTPIETDERFINRLEGSASLGFSTDKGSEVTQFSINADVRYRAREYLVGLNLSGTITDQPGAETTERRNLRLNYQRFRDNRWFTDWTASTEKNEELGINNRLSAGVGIGRYLVQTNEYQFSLVGGVVGTRESFIGGQSSTTNLEGKLSAKYLNRSVAKNSDISLSFDAFPLLEDLSSYRTQTDLTIRREFIEDLFLDLSVFHTFISDPPMNASQEDYGITTSLGYSF